MVAERWQHVSVCRRKPHCGSARAGLWTTGRRAESFCGNHGIAGSIKRRALHRRDQWRSGLGKARRLVGTQGAGNSRKARRPCRRRFRSSKRCPRRRYRSLHGYRFSFGMRVLVYRGSYKKGRSRAVRPSQSRPLTVRVLQPLGERRSRRLLSTRQSSQGCVKRNASQFH